MKLQTLIPRFDPEHPRSAIENMKLLADASDAEILAFLHDDVDVHDPDWTFKVTCFFEWFPKVGLVGFGGALGLGTWDIYKRPYDFRQLARQDYYSAQDGWENHGDYLNRALRVTMLDGYALIFRRQAYEEMGRWDAALANGLEYHMYDFWACCRMEELGWEVWALPISCNHHGGGTSVKAEYDAWLKSRGIEGDGEIHRKAHEICYERFRRILPWRLR